MKPSPCAARVAGDLRPAGGDVDRHRRLGTVVDRRLVGLVVVTLERHALATPQLAHQPHRLAHAREALLVLGPLDAGDRDLVHRLAGADAEHHAAGEQAAHRRERLGDHGGVVAEGGGEHAGAEQHALGALADRAHPRERERRVAAFVAPRLVVVGDGDGVEAVVFGEHAELDEPARAELLGGGLVADLDWHPYTLFWVSPRDGCHEQGRSGLDTAARMRWSRATRSRHSTPRSTSAST